MTATDSLKSIQSVLKNAGLYSGAIDGIWGNGSKNGLSALVERVVAERESPPERSDAPDVSNDQTPVDARSEANLETLHPRVRPLIRAVINRAAVQGITAVLTSGTRTYAEQDALFRQPTDGRDNDDDGRVDEPDERVTKAPSGHSNHNFGLAGDITIFSNGKPVWESPNYAVVGRIGESLGLTWGGRWSTPDEPHLELRPEWAASMSEGQMLAELRARHSSGKDAFA